MDGSADQGKHVIGVISDTHGLLRPESMRELKGSELIIHAGDIGAPEVLDTLRHIAPVRAVRGNTDKGTWARALSDAEVVVIGGLHLYVLHDLNDLELDPGAAGFAAVVSGHSHRPSVEHRNGVLFLNPGSAGPRRFALPVSVARVHVRDGKVDAEIVELHV